MKTLQKYPLSPLLSTIVDTVIQFKEENDLTVEPIIWGYATKNLRSEASVALQNRALMARMSYIIGNARCEWHVTQWSRTICADDDEIIVMVKRG